MTLPPKTKKTAATAKTRAKNRLSAALKANLARRKAVKR